MSIHEKLCNIQKTLHAPKSRVNAHLRSKHRNCEDILSAVKPILGDCHIVISDEIFSIEGRVYVKSTATISDSKGSIFSTAYAREPLEKNKLDVSQITGAASSYARKYALNGLLLIDDSKDADSMDNSKPVTQTKEEVLKKIMGTFGKAEASIVKCTNIEDIDAAFGKVEEYYKPNVEKFKAVKEFMDEISKVRDKMKLKLTEKRDA